MNSKKLVDELTANTSDLIYAKLENFESLWREMYRVDESLMRKYCNSIYSHIGKLLMELEQSIVEKKARLVAGIDEQLLERDKLERELGTIIETCQNEEDPLQERLKTLKSDLERYRHIRKMRTERFAELKEKENELCVCLMESVLDINVEVPSEQQLKHLENRCSELEKLKVKRQDDFNTIRSRLTMVLSNLELSPVNDFETRFLDLNNDWSQLTPTVMQKIKNVEEKYVRLEDQAKHNVNFLKGKLIRLMDQINLNEQAREEFFNSVNGIGQSASQKLSQEITRCENIRRENLVPIIGNLRSQITVLWDSLTYTEEQRNQFQAFCTEIFNEDVLELHEIEKHNLEELYNTNRHIYEMVAKREKLRHRMAQLIQQMTDPKRLKNRGGQLLKEERERKALEKNLPTIDSNLKEALVNYYTERGTSFLWYGEDLLQKIQKEKENCGNYYIGLTKSPKMNRRALTSHRRSRSLQNLADGSMATYSQFQDEIDSVGSSHLRVHTPQPSIKRAPLTPRTGSVSRLAIPHIRCTPVGTPRRVLKRAHSSPTIVGSKLTPFKARKVEDSRRLCLSEKKNVQHF